ncbi:MAG: hypothetical protein ACRD6W_01680, partial [Nitrososphaerales archaeon]
MDLETPRTAADKLPQVAKRGLFLLVTTIGAAAIGALGIGFGYWAFNSSPNCAAQGCSAASYYRALAIANAIFLATVFLWSRPDT